jgi:hypothetical protein
MSAEFQIEDVASDERSSRSTRFVPRGVAMKAVECELPFLADCRRARCR